MWLHLEKRRTDMVGSTVEGVTFHQYFTLQKKYTISTDDHVEF